MTKQITRLAVSTAAIVAAAATFVILKSGAGVDLVAHTGDTVRPVTLSAVLVAAAVSALAGWALLAVLERLTARARAGWTVTAVAVLVLSLLAGPLAGVTDGAKLGLALLHLSVGLVVIAGMRWSTR